MTRTTLRTASVLGTLGLALALAGCASDAGQSEALVQREVGKLSPFDLVTLDGPFDATLTVGDPLTVDIRGPEALITDLEVDIADGHLALKLNRADLDPDDGVIEVAVGLPRLRALTLRGRGEVHLAGPRGETLAITSAGATSLTVSDLDVTTLQVELAGASKAMLSGRAKRANLALSGVGHLDAAALEAEDIQIELSGAGAAKLHATGSVRGALSGAGKVSIAGNPATREVEVSGVGAVVYE